MKHPLDDYEDARKTEKALDREHADAKKNGYYPGSRGIVSRFFRFIVGLVIVLFVLGVIAAIILSKYGDQLL